MSSPRLPSQLTDQNAGPVSTDGGRPETMVDKTAAFIQVEDPLPRTFGRYELRRPLGKGGMGRVYLAHDPQLDRLVALKMPNPVDNIAGWRDRFFVEARAAATLTHPHVCAVYEVGEVDGQPYLTMAFIEGETVAATLARQGPMTPAAAVELVAIVARAMHEAHQRGIIHRDLKPANLILDGAGRPIIMDFGLAIRSTSADDLRLTLTGVALGTPAYMPPEQAGGDHDTIGPASDVYSLGVVLFELLTGRPPFRGKTFGKLLAQIERDPPPRPSVLNPAVDEALEAIVLKALAKAPADRFASAREFADALECYQHGDHAGVISRYSGPYRIPDTTSEFQTSLLTVPTKTSKPRRTGRWVALAVALFAVVVACGAAIYVETDYGQIVVQFNDPNAKVDVRVNGQEVTLDPGGTKAVRVRAGANRKLEVTGADFETVSESFDVKRGGVSVARVTLVPKGGGDAASKGPPAAVVAVPKKTDPSKPVGYPKAPTLIEMPGWQILADANKVEMQKWLDARKAAGHSVMWLDAFQIGDKPVYSAVAALDGRQTDWRTMLDVPILDVADPKRMAKRVDPSKYRAVALSGYWTESEAHAVVLWHPGARLWAISPTNAPSFIGTQIKNMSLQGAAVRILRLYSIGERGTAYAAYGELAKGPKGAYAIDRSASGIETFLSDERPGGRPYCLSAGLKDGVLVFAATMEPNPEKWDWETDMTLTAIDLKAKAEAQSMKGFRPGSVTAYPWDGAVRYCVVWVKEPAKPVE
jgi:Protein kinase domain/Bacterial tandem repeat domain 1